MRVMVCLVSSAEKTPRTQTDFMVSLPMTLAVPIGKITHIICFILNWRRKVVRQVVDKHCLGIKQSVDFLKLGLERWRKISNSKFSVGRTQNGQDQVGSKYIDRLNLFKDKVPCYGCCFNQLLSRNVLPFTNYDLALLKRNNSWIEITSVTTNSMVYGTNNINKRWCFH